MNKPSYIDEIPQQTSVYKTNQYLRKHQLKYSFKTIEKQQEYVKSIQRYYEIPWRKDQKMILDFFMTNSNWKEIVVQAIFGGGKTTMILSLIYHLILSLTVIAKDIFICAFNCAIKNELIKKTKKIGKCQIQTFDSLIYHLCRQLNYPNLKLLNFETKRKYVFEHLEKIEPYLHIKYVFIDESQDLEKNCYFILKHSFPNAKFMFVGDIFQSIQKEPRDSLLWYLLNQKLENVYTFKMYDTPRVPRPILKELKKTLYQYYPEYQSTILEWKSSSLKKNKKHSIEWKSFKTYQQVYNDILVKLDKWKHNKTMILTFSSSITVRGSLGDVSRFRRFFHSHQIPLNTNHKKMLDDRLFLTTANSSKGLERKNVIVVLTFPLELAFSNFSDDLVMNLITVAISRTKKNILFYVPEHNDRFSKVLSHFQKCPIPILNLSNNDNISLSKDNDKSSSNNKKKSKSYKKKETQTFHSNVNDPIEMLELEHSVTEILRQNILSFETRELLLSYAKLYYKQDIPINNSSLNCFQTDEECTLLGILFESLVLSFWTNKFPNMAENVTNHHLIFQEQIPYIQKQWSNYQQYVNSHPISNEKIRLDGCYLYSKLHLMIFHKINVEFNNNKLSIIYQKWNNLKEYLNPYRLSLSNYTLDTQKNITMPFINGIIDACGTPKHNKQLPILIYEIKASKANDWKKMALLQSIIYGILSAKSYFTIYLINVLSSSFLSFNVSFKQELMNLRYKMIQDIIVWNLNCFLSKNIKNPNNLLLKIDYSKMLFIEQDSDNICICYIMSPTKVRIDIIPSNELDQIQEIINLYKTRYEVSKIYTFEKSPSFIETFSLFKDNYNVDYIVTAYSQTKLDMNLCYIKLAFGITAFICHSHIFNLTLTKF